MRLKRSNGVCMVNGCIQAARILVLLSLLCSGTEAFTQATNSQIRFKEHLIDVVPGAYHCTVADINGDGKPDIVVISETNNEITWYENPTWTKHLVSSKLSRNIDVVAYDILKTGKAALFIASEFDMGTSKEGGRVVMLRQGSDPSSEWTASDIGFNPVAHRIRWADWDGNGRKELVVTPLIGVGAAAPLWSEPVSIQSYSFQHIDSHNAGLKPSIGMREVDHTLGMSHGVCVCDFDGDKKDDLLVASFEGITWFKPVGKGIKRTWLKTRIGAGHASVDPTKRGSSEIDRGWLTGKRPFLTAIEPWHGNEVVVYYPPKKLGELWSRHVIDDSIVDGHALECVDLNGDGQSEIVAGGRAGSHNLYYYQCSDRDGFKWERYTIDEGDMSSAGVAAADIYGTGRMDLVAPARITGKVKLYENLGR